MADQTFPSTSKPHSNHWDRDVFLSFRGEDTRKNFTDHLYSALVHAGIHTFQDDDELPRGENISTELLNAIRGSRISIVVFSKGYASSKWCLDELAEILNCTETRGHTLLPIFYHVNPSYIRKQAGTFAKAFAKHEKCFQVNMERVERVQRWRKALIEATDHADLDGIANGYESNFIDQIVEDVFYKVKPDGLCVAEKPVGLDYRIEEMKALLSLETSDIRIVGIYGMGRIGKTTLAKAVYKPFVRMINKTRGEIYKYYISFYVLPLTVEDYLSVFKILVPSNQVKMESGGEIEVSIARRKENIEPAWKPIEVKRCGIHLASASLRSECNHTPIWKSVPTCRF